MRHFIVLLEKGPRNYSAYTPSLDGCIATGKTRDEVIANMVEAIQLHLRGMLEDGEEIPYEEFEAITVVVPEPEPRPALAVASQGD